MQSERLSSAMYLAIIGLLFYLFYKLMSPFLVTIAWSMVLTIIFYPLFTLVLRYIRHAWAASLVTLLVILLVMIGPFMFVITSLIGEVNHLYNTIEKQGLDSVTDIQSHPMVQDITQKLSSYKLLQRVNLQESIVNSLKSIGQYFVKNVSSVFANAFVLVMNFIIMFLTIYYFLIDGPRLLDYLRKVLPFSDRQKIRLVDRVKETVIAAVYGQLAVGITQGTLGGVAFWILGLTSPVFWGTVMAIASFVPLFGTFLIWGPASIILILSESYAKGIGLFLFGALVISSVDGVLKPLIIGGKAKLHTLLVFFCVLGGIKFLGFLGFILGPLIAALCLSVFEIYTEEA